MTMDDERGEPLSEDRKPPDLPPGAMAIPMPFHLTNKQVAEGVARRAGSLIGHVASMSLKDVRCGCDRPMHEEFLPAVMTDALAFGIYMGDLMRRSALARIEDRSKHEPEQLAHTAGSRAAAAVLREMAVQIEQAIAEKAKGTDPGIRPRPSAN